MPLTDENKLRTVFFRPYRKGQGPAFRLRTWDCNGRDPLGKWRVGYELTEFTPGGRKASHRVIFTGEDFACAPSHAVDSDRCVESIMSFLTLRPGDTDPEWFDSYTPEQLDFCREHAEWLAGEVCNRFGEGR